MRITRRQIDFLFLPGIHAMYTDMNLIGKYITGQERLSSNGGTACQKIPWETALRRPAVKIWKRRE